MLKSALISILTVSTSAWCASSPLFSKAELQALERLKSDEATISSQLNEIKLMDANFFADVLNKTAAEDLATMKRELPFVLDKMEKAEEAAWLKKTLIELSRPN
ncbi:MAG: hypothetical protein CME71_06690 [Halobacteriovorax sp.]|nr:hypothetical protein [Halobacteriovorax sp.]|tara:strand:- start:310 stop:621 length:312 start_codon:yes stop_codon:yes gene_type:complete